MPIFNSEQLAQIPNEPYKGIEYICNSFDDFETWVDHNHEDVSVVQYLEYWTLLKIFCSKHGLDFPQLKISPRISHPENEFAAVRSAFRDIRAAVSDKIIEKELEAAEELFTAHLGTGVAFELSDGDIEVINAKILELRNAIDASTVLEDKHKERLLKRLEALQSEIHKKQSNYDKMIGTMVEVMTVVKKVGEAAEPWGRLVRDICAAIAISQGRAYELPSSTDTSFLN